MNYVFDLKSQIQSLFDRNVIDFSLARKSAQSNQFISDIHDEECYQDFLKTKEGEGVLNGNGIKFIVNTDGIEISDKSNITIWPVYLAVSEIPLEKRYCLENIIVAGYFNSCFSYN